jgi:hypothetical protein
MPFWAREFEGGIFMLCSFEGTGLREVVGRGGMRGNWVSKCGGERSRARVTVYYGVVAIEASSLRSRRLDDSSCSLIPSNPSNFSILSKISLWKIFSSHKIRILESLLILRLCKHPFVVPSRCRRITATKFKSSLFCPSCGYPYHSIPAQLPNEFQPDTIECPDPLSPKQ